MRSLWLYAIIPLSLALTARLADAGCGCDKAPPPPAPIRPFAAAPGWTVTLFSPRLVEGTTYRVSFGQTPSGVVSATAVRKRDYADALDKLQLVVTVPDLPPGPTSVTVHDGRRRLLAIPPDDFTLLQRPLTVAQRNATTIATCYRSAVGANGTVYFPLDITPISQRMLFSGALRGYRLTFNASDLSIYNSQGVLMQLLGPDEAGIFSIRDDALVDDPLVGTPRWRVAGDQILPDSILIDFDPDPDASLARLYSAPTQSAVNVKRDFGTGVPATGGLEVKEAGGAATLAAFLKSIGGFETAGAKIDVSVDLQFDKVDSLARGFVGLFSSDGGRALLAVSSQGTSAGQTGVIQIAMNNAVDGSEGVPVDTPLEAVLPQNWLRLKASFEYTGAHIRYAGDVLDLGPDGIDPGTLLASLSGTLENPLIEGNPVVLGAFAGFPGLSSDEKLRFDNFRKTLSLPTTTTTTSTTTSTTEPDPGTPTTSTTSPPVERRIKSFRLDYDRHEFQTYRALHASNPDYFLDPEDLAWHANGTRHIDHDHLIIAVDGLVNGQTPPTPGATPLSDFHITTNLVDTPQPGTLPITILEGKCDLTPACAPVPQTGCGRPTRPGAARLAIRNRSASGSDRLAWDWRGGEIAAAAGFGDPMVRDGVALCVYDEAAAPPALVLQSHASAGGTCRGGKSCWRPLGRPRGSGGFLYRGAAHAAEGLDRVLLQAGGPGRAKIVAAGSGAQMALPSPPLPLPLRVQLQAQSGQCWEASYSAAGVRRNVAGRFKAKAD